MGTDIHTAIEVYRDDGAWHFSRPKDPCRWYNEIYTDPLDVKDVNKRRLDYLKGNPSGGKYWKVVKLGDRKHPWDTCKYRYPEAFTARNYRTFAVVGNVRNGTGFAGVYTHDEIPYIQDNRGYPDDMTVFTKNHMSDEHSAGWVTLDELKNYNYHFKMTEGGVLDEAMFLRFCHTGALPETWSGSVSGQNIVTLDAAQYATLYESPIDLLQGKEAKKGPNYDPTKSYHVFAKWERDLYDEVRDIPELWIPYLEKLVPKGGTDEDVRVVFDFDS